MQPLFILMILLTGMVASMTFVVVLGLWSSRKIDFNWSPEQAEMLPHSRRSLFFSAAERSFYDVLRRLVPDHMILVKVKLTDLVSVKAADRSRWRHFNPINRKHVDFVVCDPTLAPVLAIELDDSPDQREDRHSRDKFVDAVLASASLPIVHVPARRGYILNELRRLLTPYLRTGAPMM